MTVEEIFKNHTQWMIDNYGKYFMQFIINFHNYKTYVLNDNYVSKEYPYNGYIENLKPVKNALIFYLQRFGVKVLEEEKYRYGILIKWNDDFVNKLDVALKIVISNEKMNKLNEDFKE